MHKPVVSDTPASAGLYARDLRAIERIASRRPLTTDEDVLRAALLVHTGDIDAAQKAANELLQRHRLSDLQTCRIHDVLGTCYFRRGSHQQGLAEFDRGVKLAQANRDSRTECSLRVHSLRHQIHWTALANATSKIADVRRLVHHVADPDLSLQFQLALVELATKLGLLPRARRHLETARTLETFVENKALKAEFVLVELTLNGYESNLSEALRLGLQLAPLLPDIGSSSIRFGVFTNLGYLLMAHGRFDEAFEWLNQGVADPKFNTASRIAMRDTLMMLHVSRGALAEAAAEADTIQQLIQEHDGQDTFFGLWHALTRVKWLYRSGQIEAGLLTAENAIPKAKHLEDRALTVRLQLLAADGMARLNRRGEAMSTMAMAVSTYEEPAPEIIAEIARVTGQIVAIDNPRLAATCYDQACNILTAVGNFTARDEVVRDAQFVAKEQRDTLIPPGVEVTSRIASLVNLGSHPLVVGTELLAIVHECRVAVASFLVETTRQGQPRVLLSRTEEPITFDDAQKADGVATISTGRHNGHEYVVYTVPKPEVSAKATMLAVERLTRASLRISEARQDQREQVSLWPDQPPEQSLGLIYVSERMRELVQTVRRAANAPLSVLLTGESGVGKELFARALHQASSRRDKTFLPFNCATVPKDMLDSQLFGHRRGAFTGAHETGVGVIRAADGGTLFLDEIGEMSMEAQPKLLRFLESGEIHPLGEPKPVHVDVRIVAATNADLDQLVSEGKFRQDLLYRLNVLPIHIPPLRERREEVPGLVDHFVEKFAREMQKPMVRVANETLEYLLLYRWPGNVRQLANEIRRMVALAEPGAMLTPAHLSNEIASTRRTVAVEPSEFVMRLDQPLAHATDQLERAAIERALAAANGNNDQAAKILGLSRKGLYLKRQRLGLK